MTYLNEFLFIFHLLAVATVVMIALRMGKEALMALMGVYVIIMNLFVTKQIGILGYSITATDSFTVGTGLILNLLQEYWSKEEAIKATKLSFFLAAIFVIMSSFQLSYIPHCMDNGMHAHFVALLNWTPRIIVASLIAFLVTQFVDTTLYGFLKKQTGQKYFILRNYSSLLVSQAVDTVLFAILGLYGIASNLWAVIIASYIVKILAILIATPYVSMARKLVKKDNHKS